MSREGSGGPPRDPFLEAVAASVERFGGLPLTGSVHVALSGGKDSVALLATLVALTPGRVRAHHIQHGLREDDALDAACCRRVCASLGVELEVTSLTLDRRGEGEGLQSAARHARYAALLEHARALGAAVATGHHADDTIETVLMRWTRGAGLDGMAGIPARTRRRGWEDIEILRPLLGVARAEIEAFIARVGLESCEDPSNASDHYFRNRVRREVLPALAAAARRPIVAPMQRTVENLRGDAEALRGLGEAWLQTHGVFLAEEPAFYLPITAAEAVGRPVLASLLRRAARRVCPEHTLEARALERALEGGEAGRRPWRDAAVHIGREGRFWVVRANDAARPDPWAPERCVIAGVRWRQWSVAGLSLSLVLWTDWGADTSLPTDANEAVIYLDAERAGPALLLRPAARGERLVCVSRGGQRTRLDIFELLRARGVPTSWRGDMPLLVDAEDRILWVPGVRRGDAASVGEGTTRVLRVALERPPWYVVPNVSVR